MKTENLIKTARVTALLTLVIGLLILLAYALTLNINLAFSGLYFFWVAGIFNLVIFISLLVSAVKNANARRKLLLTAALLLINVPVSIVCFLAGISYSNTYRLHLRNNTASTITNIQLKGCNEQSITKMLPGEEQTLSIYIPGDCQLSMSYSRNGKKHEEIIQGYLTRQGGGSSYYNIEVRSK